MKLHDILSQSQPPPVFDGLILGIDPGITGAIATIWQGEVAVYDQPVRPIPKRQPSMDYDVARMIDLLRTILATTISKDGDGSFGLEDCPVSKKTAFCYLEHIHAMPREGRVIRGSKATWTLAGAFWLWTGILASQGVERVLVDPKTWKRFYGLLLQEKEASRMMARELFPHLGEALKFKKHHNRAEALLIAQYGLTQSLTRQEKEKKTLSKEKAGW